MKGVYVRNDSPYYWLRYYDKLESSSNANKKKKSLNTKIEVTEADWKRFRNKEKLIGTQKIRELSTSFRTALAQKNIEFHSGVKILKEPLLSEGYKEFKIDKSVPGSKERLKEKTLINYTIAVDHMIAACGDKKIYKYSGEKDYVALLHYFEALDLPGKTIIHKDGKVEKTTKKMSQNSRSIYTRSLRALWNYFCDKNYAARNIIEPVDPEDKDPNPIPLDEMFSIVNYFRDDLKNPCHYHLVYFMLLTGCRPSSAMVQLKEDIDLKRKVIKIKNVKTGKKKNKEYFQFPIYKELKLLLEEMGVKQGDTGRLFHQFKLNELNYTYPLSFWERGIKSLKIGKKVQQYYIMKQIRPTTASFMINVLKVDAFTVQKLLDHTDIKITDKHYIKKKISESRKLMDDFNLNDFIDDSNWD